MTTISSRTVTATLAKTEVSLTPETGALWWSLTSTDPQVLPPLALTPADAIRDMDALRHLAVSYLAAAGLVHSDQVLLPWRTVGHTVDGAPAFQVTLTNTVTAI